MKKTSVLCSIFFLLSLGAGNALSLPFSQEFNEREVGLFDSIELYMTGDVSFLNLGGFAYAPDWAQDAALPNYVSAFGTPTTNLNFNVTFSDTTPFTFHFYALETVYGEKMIKEAAVVSYNSTWSTWNIRTVFEFDDALAMRNADVASVAPVPEPATLLLLGTGLVGVIGFRGGRKKPVA